MFSDTERYPNANLTCLGCDLLEDPLAAALGRVAALLFVDGVLQLGACPRLDWGNKIAPGWSLNWGHSIQRFGWG